MTSEIFLHRLLQKHDVPLKAVELLNVPPLGIQPAVIGNAVDAASTWEPFAHNTKAALEGKAVSFKDATIYTGYMHLAAANEWLRNNPEKARKVINALAKAKTFAIENEDEAKQVLSTVIGLDMPVIDEVWHEHIPAVHLNLDKIIPDVTQIGEWIVATKESYGNKTVPNYAKYYDPSFSDD